MYEDVRLSNKGLRKLQHYERKQTFLVDSQIIERCSINFCR